MVDENRKKNPSTTGRFSPGPGIRFDPFGGLPQDNRLSLSSARPPTSIQAFGLTNSVTRDLCGYVQPDLAYIEWDFRSAPDCSETKQLMKKRAVKRQNPGIEAQTLPESVSSSRNQAMQRTRAEKIKKGKRQRITERTREGDIEADPRR